MAYLAAATQFMAKPHREPGSYFDNIHQICHCSPNLTITLHTPAPHVSTRRPVMADWPVTTVSQWSERLTQDGELTAIHCPSQLLPVLSPHTA